MSAKTYSTLVDSASSMTQEELFEAPELPTLLALDASLLATIDTLDYCNPHLGYARKGGRSENEVDDRIAESIRILATALRDNLSAYYAAIRISCKEGTDQSLVDF